MKEMFTLRSGVVFYSLWLSLRLFVMKSCRVAWPILPCGCVYLKQYCSSLWIFERLFEELHHSLVETVSGLMDLILCGVWKAVKSHNNTIFDQLSSEIWTFACISENSMTVFSFIMKKKKIHTGNLLYFECK